MPVPVVIAGGMPMVSLGSQITAFGIIFGWKMIFLVWVSLVSTAARPTSEPVPAVVGTATTGAIASASARFHQSPMSSKSHTGRVWPTMKATSLPTSSPEPPPKATTPSWPPARYAAMPAVRLASTGLGRTSANKPGLSPASARMPRVRAVMSSVASPVSVTRSGRAIPAARHALGSSTMRPAPKRMAVG